MRDKEFGYSQKIKCISCVSFSTLGTRGKYKEYQNKIVNSDMHIGK